MVGSSFSAACFCAATDDADLNISGNWQAFDCHERLIGPPLTVYFVLQSWPLWSRRVSWSRRRDSEFLGDIALIKMAPVLKFFLSWLVVCMVGTCGQLFSVVDAEASENLAFVCGHESTFQGVMIFQQGDSAVGGILYCQQRAEARDQHWSGFWQRRLCCLFYSAIKGVPKVLFLKLTGLTRIRFVGPLRLIRRRITVFHAVIAVWMSKGLFF